MIRLVKIQAGSCAHHIKRTEIFRQGCRPYSKPLQCQCYQPQNSPWLARTFKTKNFIKWDDFFEKDKTNGKTLVPNEEIMRHIFAEGYIAGKFGGKTPNSMRILIVALVCGVITGLVLPPLIITAVGYSGEERKEFPLKMKQEFTTFADVKGVDEAKEELEEIVEYLRRPLKYTKLGAKLPKGILLVGPPGTGKTLLARALAGEAGVPYFHMSGSEFEQTYVGEGARKVRELFKIAKRNTPCVIFIDEIDSVGSKRFQHPLHPHANQTINQLLTEMDGFRKMEGVIILAATNRRDDLDDALLRPGRFDIEVYIAPPNYTGRKDILEHYLQRISTKDIDLDELSRGTVGFTGADIENMVNRAALRAGTAESSSVTMRNLLEERDRIIMGPEKRSNIPDPQTNRITAFHEGGHCVVSYFTPNSQPLHKVTIIPRGNAVGHTAYLPDKDEVYLTKAQILARLDSLLGGRAAEEIIFGEEFVTTGAASDLLVATELATHMVTRWGMSSKLGLPARKSDEFKQLTKCEMVDDEVRQILHDSYERAKSVLQSRSKEHKLLAEALLKYETLDANDIQAILSKKKKP